MDKAVQEFAVQYAEQGFYVIRLYRHEKELTKESFGKVAKYLYFRIVKPLLSPSILDFILRYIPCNKRISDFFGYYRGTKNPQQAKKLFSSGQHNVAIRAGRISDLVVVDIDKNSAVEAFIKKYKCSPTRTVATPKGVHLYFKYPKKRRVLSSVKRIPDVDIIADNANVVAPPSLYVDGKQTYRWVDKNAEIAEMPEMLIQKIIEIGHPSRDQNQLATILGNNVLGPLWKYFL